MMTKTIRGIYMLTIPKHHKTKKNHPYNSFALCVNDVSFALYGGCVCGVSFAVCICQVHCLVCCWLQDAAALEVSFGMYGVSTTCRLQLLLARLIAWFAAGLSSFCCQSLIGTPFALCVNEADTTIR
eukprot:89914-Amphidinium_carterae.2